MTKVYDDWERLVRATLRRDELWQLCHDHSRTPSGGSTTSGPSPGSSSPIDEVAPKSSSTRVSPLNRQNRQNGAEFNREVAPKSSSTRVSRLNHQNRQNGAELNREVVTRSSSARVSPLNHQNRQGGNESKNEKSMRRSKSRMRLDRWVWTRWLSNTF